MAVHGYLTHAARSRRVTAWLVLLYLMVFEVIGAVALTFFLLLFDPDYVIFTNPLGYAARYATPIAVLSAFLFWRQYRGHAKSVTALLEVRLVSRADEPRFVQIAEEQCIALGVRLPRFGVIDVPQPNAATVGEGPVVGLIAVTRGLLEMLDDDELAAVFAHEASHIRNGDTRLLAVNHALMRTAVLFQVNNVLRLEDWRQLIIVLVMPPFLLLLLAGSAVTMMSMKLARVARRGLKVSRDHVADGEAVRVTHFPQALVSAIRKVGGRGGFHGSFLVDGVLFDGSDDQEGGSHPSARDRIAAIGSLAGDLMTSTRQRRDTRHSRPGLRPASGRHGLALVTAFPRDASGRPLEQPPTATLAIMWMSIINRDAYRDWQNATTSWWEWRAGEQRNAFGLTPKLLIPLVATFTFLLVFHWPSDGDYRKLRTVLGPAPLIEMFKEVNAGPRCEGPSYPDGLCDHYDYSDDQRATIKAARATEKLPSTSPQGAMWAGLLVPLMALGFMIAALTKPKLLRDLFGVVETQRPLSFAYEEAKQRMRSEQAAQAEVRIGQSDIQILPCRRGFGRKAS